MKFDEYQKQALKTVLKSSNNLPYIALGLTNEAGEVAGKVKKWVRDNNSDVELLDKKAITDELGDTLWYLTLMAHVLGVSLDDVAKLNLKKLDKRLKTGTLTGSGDYRQDT